MYDFIINCSKDYTNVNIHEVFIFRKVLYVFDKHIRILPLSAYSS